MSALGTFPRLNAGDRALVLRAIPLVTTIRIALWLLSVRRVRQLLVACEGVPLGIPAEVPVSRLVWAVRAVSRRIPMASCLTQSLALQFLLSRTGRSSQVYIGVRKDPQAGFQSHAWVEYAGSPLLSTPSEVGDYSRLLAVEN